MDKIIHIIKEAKCLFDSLPVLDIKQKSVQDYVTNVDKCLDDFLTKSLQAMWPSIPVLSEERPETWGYIADRCWVLDPLDGTHNTIAKLPFFSISIALLEKGETLLAAVCNLASGDLYVAEKGMGAYLGEKRLSLPETPGELILLSTGALDYLQGHQDLYDSIRVYGKIRNLGSQSLHLCLVATGQVSLAMSTEARLWDDAAGRLIAIEAGAKYHALSEVKVANDMPYPMGSLCGAPNLASKLLKMLR